MGALFSKPKMPSSMPPVIQYVQAPEVVREEVAMEPMKEVTAPAPTDSAGKELAAAEAEKRRKAANAAKGASSMILTGGLGLKDEAPVQRKQLFGE